MPSREKIDSFVFDAETPFDGLYEEFSENIYRRKADETSSLESWAYKHENRWAIGPEVNSENYWAFTGATTKKPSQIRKWVTTDNVSETPFLKSKQDEVAEKVDINYPEARFSTLKGGTSIEDLLDASFFDGSTILEENTFKETRNFYGVYLFKRKDRWCIGPDYTKSLSWFFTKDHTINQAQFYRMDFKSGLVRRFSMQINADNDDFDSFFMTERPSSKNPLTEDERATFLGNYIKLRGQWF